MELVSISTTPLEYGVEPLTFSNRGYYIYVTEACNLRCNYCFVSDKLNHRHLTPAMADKILAFVKEDASKLRETYIHFFGGEPLIRASMIEYLATEFREWSKRSGVKVKFGVTTNGTLLTKQNCELLKRNDIGVQLSLDGGKEGNNIHRQIMGGSQQGLPNAGAFDLVHIQNYFEYFGKGRPNCRMTCTVHNVPYLSKSIEELHKLGFKSFSIIPDSDCGEWTPTALAQYESEMSLVFEYWATNRDIEVNTIEHTMEKLAQKKIQSHLCQAGRSILGITIDGDIYPCHDFSGRFSKDPEERNALLIGNVEKGFTPNQYKFSDMSYQQKRSGNGYDCTKCWARWTCGHGCPYMNYARTRDLFEVNATYCSTNRIHATIALRWMSSLEEYRFVGTKDVASIRQKLAKAVLNAAGGEEEAAFGRNQEGRAMLPSSAKMRELGFDPFPEAVVAQAAHR
jgi:uncharacterized protein